MNIFFFFQNKYLRIIILAFFVVAISTVYIKLTNNLGKDCRDCNVILISVDTLRADHMGIYGYNKNTTPNIDRWAKNALVFTGMRTLTPTTYPSFTMFMTSKSPFITGIYSNSTGYSGAAPGLVPLSPQTKTLSQILTENGYSTAAFLNTSALDPELTHLNKGFDTYKMFSYAPLNGPSRENKSFNNISAALDWIKENRNKKMFVWIHLMEPHAPYLPTREFYCKFNTAGCDQIKGLKDLQLFEKERKQLKECRPEGIARSKITFFEGLYDGAIASADKLIGNIFTVLKEKNLDKKSMVIFYGDHGEGFDHNYFFFHNHNLYESFVRIPLIINIPNQSIKGFNSNNLTNLQIAPTILNLLGITYDKNDFSTKPFDSLLAKSADTTVENEYNYFINDARTKFGIQNDNYKYIYSQRGNSCLYNNQEEELYNFVDDPHELNNLVVEEPELAFKLKANLFNFMKKSGAFDKISTSSAELPINSNTFEELKTLGY